MTDEREIIQAIRKYRGNLVPRLVYADWLEEKGDPRCEYLRLQCRMEELQKGIDPGWLSSMREERFRSNLSLSGFYVELRQLEQFAVYDGLLEGLPTKEMNQREIRHLVERSRKANGTEPYLIEPEETPIKYRDDRQYPFGEPACIPSIACVGRFRCSQPARDPNEHYSELEVIWFQDHLALPFGEDVFPKLKAINWEKYASDYTD